MKTLQVSEETWERIKDQLDNDEAVDISGLADLQGEKWFFRTVTYHLVGKVKKVIGNWAVLEDASWVADSGRFMSAIKNGTLSEVEPVGACLINLSTVVDAFPWRHELPKEQK